MKIKKNDTIIVISGKDRGKKGKVLQVFPNENRIIVEGINLRKRHRKPKKSGEKGQIVVLPAAIAVSNAKLICLKCGQPSRLSYKINQGKKYRICKKCGQET
ncbi:MAG TPA: 50S ribosomal protein L24 [Patescibacteria group bacterium]|nr:50S ribosomal protein L24 [Patescibacteria group bacterium]